MRAAVVSTMFGAAAAATTLPLVTFDGNDARTTFAFKELNDPVMGGKSSGNWSVQDGSGVMQGVVVNVPSLSAPGFIKSSGDGTFADVSAALSGGLKLTVRSPSAEYTGFRLSFAAGTLSPDYSCAGGGSIPLSRGCFKRQFAVKGGSEFSEVYLPFNSFSDKWSPATGKQTTTCAEDADVCPKASDLAGIKRMEFWAEGVNGNVRLEVKRVEAVYGAATTEVSAPAGKNQQPPAEFDRCSEPVQENLRFGISGRNTPIGLPVAVNGSESLAAAVCCDSRMLPYAEPQFLYQAPDILLISKLNADGVTTWYDSSCGLPLFKSPVNRTFDDFAADTKEHGWPSFRPAEVVKENVVTDETTGYVTSTCGTHLGSYLPDAEGPRWCIDLSCISGNEKKN